MKNINLARTSLVAFLALSACIQPSSTNAKASRAQTAGPQTIADTSTKDPKNSPATKDKTTVATACTTTDGNTALAQIGEGGDALFQILMTDPNDLTTVRNRAESLLTLETEYSANFIESCAATGLTDENTSARIQKLTALSTETDAVVIHTLASQIWDLFNPNISIQSDGGTSSPNPFAEPATP